MVAFYKEVCIIYGAEHPLHILWLCNFISGLVAQLGERSVRIREVVGSNPIRSTMKADLFRQVCFSYASMQTFVLSFAPPLHTACNCWNCSKETLNSTSSV